MGHEDGMVTGFRLGGYRPGTCLDPHRFTQWQAHRAGDVSAITSTPWGELWTASSRGILRIWGSADQDGEALAVNILQLLQGCVRLQISVAIFLSACKKCHMISSTHLPDLLRMLVLGIHLPGAMGWPH